MGAKWVYDEYSQTSDVEFTATVLARMTMHAFGRWQGQQQWNSCAAKYVVKRHAIIMEVSNILSFPEIFHDNLIMICKNARNFVSKQLFRNLS